MQDHLEAEPQRFSAESLAADERVLLASRRIGPPIALGEAFFAAYPVVVGRRGVRSMVLGLFVLSILGWTRPLSIWAMSVGTSPVTVTTAAAASIGVSSRRNLSPCKVRCRFLLNSWAMASEFSIYTDESDRRGDYFSNFYGGVLVRSRDLAASIDQLNATKHDNNLFGEIKWQKVTANYLSKYIAIMDTFFNLIEADRAKVRIMFTNNQYVPQGLSSDQRKSEYHLLYYQFLKHSFGLPHAVHSGDTASPIRIRLNLDQMPASHEESARFKAYLVGLNNNPQMRAAGVTFDPQQIAEVDSHDHVLL